MNLCRVMSYCIKWSHILIRYEQQMLSKWTRSSVHARNMLESLFAMICYIALLVDPEHGT